MNTVSMRHEYKYAPAESENAIRSALHAFASGDLDCSTSDLLKTLGYTTSVKNHFCRNDFCSISDSPLSDECIINKNNILPDDLKTIDLVSLSWNSNKSFQNPNIINGTTGNTSVDNFQVITADLDNPAYSRTMLFKITRILNKYFSVPSVFLFKYGGHLSLSISCQNNYPANLPEKIILIKDISIHNPHCFHINILFRLSVDELPDIHKFSNYSELHDAWWASLDSKKLERQFCGEISVWYNRAVENITFQSKPEASKEIFDKTTLLHLLIRIISVWFIRENNIIPDNIFDKNTIDIIIKDFLKNRESHNYYNCIIQNLFFGVINQKIKDRSFVPENYSEEITSEYRNNSYLRYPEHFKLSQIEALNFFNSIPFLNIALFDRLDKYNKNGQFIYADGFSDNSEHKAVIPDYIFFGEDDEFNLNNTTPKYNSKNKFRGIYQILNNYTFTIIENNSDDEEYTIDPEIIGKVFETHISKSAHDSNKSLRKQTGSFYTPREIVNYMVNTSLKLYLNQKTEANPLFESADIEKIINFLLECDDCNYRLSSEQITFLINAITTCRIFDPSCGSGAFPIGILDKMSRILRKLDPENKEWGKKLFEQINSSEATDIKKYQFIYNEETLKQYNPDYVQKLYLLRNCIFGTDITPFALNICKFRFSLSLLSDQITDIEACNYRIIPSPDLEINFTEANTLLSIEYSVKPTIDFSRTGKFSFPVFDPSSISSTARGFDIIIGNPPYVPIHLIHSDERRIYKEKYKSAKGRFNLFYLFMELAPRLLEKKGFTAFIVPDRILLNTQCSDLRKMLLSEQTLIELDSFDRSIFENAIVDSVIIIYQNQPSNSGAVTVRDKIDMKTLQSGNHRKIPLEFFQKSSNSQFDLSLNSMTLNLINKIRENSVLLGAIAEIKDGIIQGKIADKLFLNNPVDDDSKKILFGENIKRYKINFNNKWVNYKPDQMMNIEIERRGLGIRHGLWLRNPNIFERNKILTRQTADEIIAAFDSENTYYSNTLHGITVTDNMYFPRYVLSILNSKLITWYYRSTTAEKGKIFAQIKIELLKLLPIFALDQRKQTLFCRIAEFIEITSDSADTDFLHALSNCMVYELYFSREINKADAGILMHLYKMPGFNEDISEKINCDIIKNFCNEVSDPSHPVQIAITKQNNIEEIKIIEGLERYN